MLARFADEDVGELWWRGDVGGEQGDAEVIGGDDDDLGVVVDREDGVAAATARTTDTTSALTSHPGGPLRPTVNHDKSSTSSPAPVAAPISTSMSATTALRKSKSISSHYTSKIRSSPLALTHLDLETTSPAEADGEARPKKRKQAGGRDTNDDTSTSALAKKKKKKMRTISMAMGQKEEKEEKTKQRKVKGKAKNAIDDLFAGLA